jgi:hypothetical protein
VRRQQRNAGAGQARELDREAWLPACQGFRLESAGRWVGVVEEVLFGDDDLPAALLVQGGLFGNRTYIVAAEDVVDVVPRSKRVLIEKRRRAVRSP